MSQPVETVSAPLASKSEPIPGYVLRQRLGAGGYGEVWASDAPGGLAKAIKFVYGLMDESRAAREFKSLSLIKGVRHPFLLSLERIEVHNGQLLIVTELADGSLKDRFEECLKQGLVGVPREELLAHLRDAADALDYMNTQYSLQHLDVKPENLLLVGGRIKVADFGLVKEIQEVSSSIMGGLTPIYAPPEVFDARPSRRSDQYSLAIVYQEMLTGVLPFPGRTAAQLATQHLTAKPRLDPLPTSDRPHIERALSKDPQHRFGSCRELVEALLHVRSAKESHRAPAIPQNGVSSQPASAITEGHASQPQLAHTAGISQPLEQDCIRRLESAEQAVAHDSQGNYESAEQAALEALPSITIEVSHPSATLVDLPPLDVDLASTACRPTLFVGIGGLAGKSLHQLRGMLADRCDAEQRKNFSLLLLDTDTHELLESAQGTKEAALRWDESLALPLRKSAEYRNDSQRYLDWLSRRWLFNIPRSQQTEGIRPFGRLAFVDHSQEVLQRLKGAISKLKTVENSTDGKCQPRVVVVGSSSGGAAGGMVLDVVFAVRQILDEQSIDGNVDLLLLHGTGRQPAAQELAAVNTFALLTEISQCLRGGGSYPGDYSCGLKSRSASERTVENLYLVHLGQDLSSDQFLAACERVAEYLYLDAATPAGNYLTACRSAQPQELRQDLTFRTFGLTQIGFSQAAVDRGIESLCRATVLRWHGEPKAPRSTSLSIRLADLKQDAQVCSTATKNVEFEQLVSSQVKALGLELDDLVNHLFLLVQEDLGGEPEKVFQKIIQESQPQSPKSCPVDRWFAGSSQFFGALGCDLDTSSHSPLQAALMNRQAQAVAPLGQQLRDWLLALPEDPAVRIIGGQWCAKWFRSHFKNLVEKGREIRSQLGVKLKVLEQKLAIAAKTAPKSNSHKDADSSPEALFLSHCQVRLYQLAAHVAMQFAQNMGSFVSQAHDQLHDLGRDVKHLADQFTESDEAVDDVVDLKALAHLSRVEEASAAILDQYFQTNVFGSSGFRAVLLGGDQRRKLLVQLRLQARQVVLDSLRQVNLSALVEELGSPDSDGTSQLSMQIGDAQPWFQKIGGERRLLYISGTWGGEGAAQDLTPEEISTLVGAPQFQQLPVIVPAKNGQVVFCYELGNLPLAHAAAKLIDHRSDFAQAAARLHARNDIEWQRMSI